MTAANKSARFSCAGFQKQDLRSAVPILFYFIYFLLFGNVFVNETFPQRKRNLIWQIFGTDANDHVL